MRRLLLSFLLFVAASVAWASQRNINGPIRAYGDSITAGIAASNVGVTDYVSLLGTHYSSITVNHGVQGDTACDLTQKVFASENPTAPVTGIYTAMIGTNDANGAGAGAYEAVFHNCHLAALSWLAIVRSGKVFAQDSACSKTGTWTVDNTYQTGIGETSSTIGSTLACSMTTQGNAIYLWYRIINGNTGTFTYSLDGGPATAATAYTTPAIAENSGTVSVGVIRIPNVAAGAHTVTLSVTSSSGSVPILAVGSPPIMGYAGQPIIYSAGVPFQASDALSATTAAYNADALADLNLIAGDGGQVYFMNVRGYWCSNCASVPAGTGDMANGLHPNDLGMSEIATGFETVIDAFPAPPPPPAVPSTHINGRVNGKFN